MSSNYMCYKMGDLTTTTNCPCPLISLNPHSAFKQSNHVLPPHKGCNASLTTHSRCKLVRAPIRSPEHSKMLVVKFVAFGLASRESCVKCEEDNVKNSMSYSCGIHDGEVQEETESSLNAEKSLVHVPTPTDDKEDFLARLHASRVTAETSQAGDAVGNTHTDPLETSSESSDIIQAQKERMMNKKTQQLTYLFAALASSVGITSLAGASVYCRFAWQMQGGEVPWTEMCGTFSLALGAAVGMEYWARWAHRALWHASLWSMHESHHRPRDGPFELNDVFAIINAVPAIALMAFGFLNKGLVPGLCFGAGLGITVFGIAYMFVHDGLVHRRFPVGPIADVPYFQKVAAAHQLHHADKFNGVPYGLFLGPMELEEIGGRMELEKVLQKRRREKTNPIKS